MSGQRCGVIVLGPSEGDTLHLGPTRPTVKAGAATGSRQLAVIDSWLPPGGGFKFPHWHEDFDEAFDVIDGQIDFLTGQHLDHRRRQQHHLRPPRRTSRPRTCSPSRQRWPMRCAKTGGS